MKDNSFGLKYASIYDDVMSVVPYESWVQYIEDTLKNYRLSPKIILDIGCGTGTLSLKLAAEGYGVWGMDKSKFMVNQAILKTNKGSVNFLQAELSKFSLPKKFDLAISFFDTLNYITSSNHLTAAIANISRHLKKNGLFIFDLNTYQAYQRNLYTQSGRINSNGKQIDYAWKSLFNKNKRLCHIKLDFVVKEDGTARKFSEIHSQRAHLRTEIISLLKANSFELLATYDCFSFNPATKTSERVNYIARKM